MLKKKVQNIDVHKISGLCLLCMIIYLCMMFVEYVGFQYSDNRLYSYFDLYGFLYFCVDYSDGIVSRGLCGEITQLLFSNSTNFVVKFITFKVVLIGLLYLSIIIFGIYCFIKRKDMIVFALSLICIRPLYLLSKFYSIRPDHFWYICLFIIIVLLFRDTKLNFNMILITLISSVAMLFHHAFIFVFAPLICLVLYDKKATKWFYTYAGLMCVEFLLLTLCCKGDYQYICNHMIDAMHDFGLWDLYGGSVFNDSIICALDMEYNSSRLFQVMSYPGLLQEYVTRHIPLLGFNLIAACGSLIFSVKVITKYMYSQKNTNMISAIILLPFIMLLLFTIDCDRWFLMTLTTLNLFSMYLLLKNKVDIVISKKWYYLFFINIVVQIIPHVILFY